MSGRRFRRDGHPIRQGARPAKAPLMPDGLRKLKEELAYAEAVAPRPKKKKPKPAKKGRRVEKKASPHPPPPPVDAGDRFFKQDGNGDLRLLELALMTAVPIRIDQLNREKVDVIINKAQMQELADDIAARGDVIMYKTKKPGETARNFTRLVEALARLSYVAGGIKFAGMHFEAPPR